MNKRLFINWSQGFEYAPMIVKECLKSWESNNPGWEIVKLSDGNLGEYISLEEIIPGISEKDLHLITISEVIRISVLEKFGGVWADSTTFCTKPLDSWLGRYIKQGFFAFSDPGPDRLVASWFLYSDRKNYIMEAWYRKMREYWTVRDKKHDYFWLHKLFNKLYRSDLKVRAIWDKVLKYNCEVETSRGPHYFFPYHESLVKPATWRYKWDIRRKRDPLYKLTYKYNHEAFEEGCVLDYLFKHGS